MRGTKCAHAVVGVFFLALLGGCATPQTRELLHAVPRNLPARVELTRTPFFPQEAHQCGPASLATVLGAAGTAVEPEQLTPQVYLPGREGSLQVEMLAAIRRHGMLAYPLAPSLTDLLTEVAAGTPAVVLQNLAFNWYPLWHYAVVVGYDLDRKQIILRSGLERRQILPLSTFEHTWARSGYWAMLALPPGKLPRTATEASYVAAAVALEQAGQARAAHAAYRAALKRWPHNLAAQIGLGNTAYARGELRQAERAYRQATADHPESAAAFNNLAQALADERRYGPALRAARRAVSLGGREQGAYRETLEEILKKFRRKGARRPGAAAR